MTTTDYENKKTTITGIRSPRLTSASVQRIQNPETKRTREPARRSVERVYQNRTTHLNSLIIYASFLVALVLMGIMVFLIPDKEISTRENRALAQFPEIDSKSIFSGKTSGDLDSWYSDQFPGRDGLVTLWKKVDGALSLRLTEDDITIVEGSSDMGQGALDPDAAGDKSDPLYTSPFFSGSGGENPNP